MPNTYVTVERMVAGLGSLQLTRLLDVPEDSDVTANATLLQKINWANGVIDSYLRGTVQLPLSGTPGDADFYPELVEHGVNLTVWGLLGSRQDAANQFDRDRYNDAIRYLRDISEGVSNLDLGTTTALVSGARIANIGQSRLTREATRIRITSELISPEHEM